MPVKSEDAFHFPRLPARPGANAKAEETRHEKKTKLEVAGKKLVVSDLDKVLSPDAGFTKAQARRVPRLHPKGGEIVNG